LNYQKALDRVFRHAWVVITILFIVEFTYDLLNGFYGAGTVDFITLAVYVAFVGLGTLTLAILLTYTRKLYRRLKSVKTNVQNLKKNMKKINSFARGMTIMTIILVVGLGFFTALQIISNQNIFVIMVSQTFQRAMELCYCLLIIIAYWRTFKRVVSTEESTKEDSNKQSSKNSSISKNEKQQKAVMV
jgi:membrane protein implicated in regulation of membrane protease activity